MVKLPITKVQIFKVLSGGTILWLGLWGIVSFWIGCGEGQIIAAQLPTPHVEFAFKPPARGFEVGEVELLSGPFRHAQDLDAAYLLRLEPDRLLHNFHKFAGLEPKGKIYGGWESMGIAGHSLGHYLSAASRMYKALGDERFLQRVSYIVDELARCQQAIGTGYVAGIPEGEQVFAEVAAGRIQAEGFSLNGVWVPWYTLHKLFAGLLDAYLYCDNKQALGVATKLADWVAEITKNLADDQWQRMLDCEHGGMNESLALLYAYTGNATYLELARKFYHRRVLDFLARQEDRLAGLHANTQIPKVIGVARLYEITGEERFGIIPKFFWDTVIQNHTYVNGGNSSGEYFGPPRHLSNRLVDTTETCNTYNMLKLTLILFTWCPEARYADYMERALWNHILAHQHPRTGMFVYKGFLDPGTRKHYSTPFDSFWCCVGTGMENHARYGEYIYFRDSDGLLVNLFVPSRLHWREKGVTVEQYTQFPEEPVTRIIFRMEKPTEFALRVRHPWWAQQGMQIHLNGQAMPVSFNPGTFVKIPRVWKDGDELTITTPMGLYCESMPDNPRMIAFLYGPLVLCAPLEEGEEIPVIVSDSEPAKKVHRKGSDPLRFHTDGLAQPRDLELIPIRLMHDRRYNVYWEWLTPEQWSARQQTQARERQLRSLLQSLVIDEVQIGQARSESDHNLASERSESGMFAGRHWRHALGGGWFSWTLRIEPEYPIAVWCTYWGSDSGGREFDIPVEGEKVGFQQLRNNAPGKFFEQLYFVPEELTKGKEQITVRFQARPGRIAGGVFGCRTVRCTPELQALWQGM